MTIGLRRLPSPVRREEDEEEGLARILADDDAVVDDDDDGRLFALILAAKARCCSKTCFSFLLDILNVYIFSTEFILYQYY